MDVEAEGKEDVRGRGLRHDRALPQGLSPVNAEGSETGRFEDAELVAPERLGMTGAGRDVTDGESETRCLRLAAAEAKARGAVRRSEQGSAEPERGHS